MKHLYGSPEHAGLNEAIKLRALISDLNRLVCVLDSNITSQEERAGASDPFNFSTDDGGTPR
jgi:hypothetical protein